MRAQVVDGERLPQELPHRQEMEAKRRTLSATRIGDDGLDGGKRQVVRLDDRIIAFRLLGHGHPHGK
jgi:hypothetical protein